MSNVHGQLGVGNGAMTVGDAAVQQGMYAMHICMQQRLMYAVDPVIEQTFRTWQRSFCPSWNPAANPGMSWGASQQSSACRRPRTAGDTASHTQSAAVSTTYLHQSLILKRDVMCKIACSSKRCDLKHDFRT